jgi:hypothetical protein
MQAVKPRQAIAIKAPARRDFTIEVILDESIKSPHRDEAVQSSKSKARKS